MKVVLPREHGAWGMLFGPLLAGMIAGGFRMADILLVFAMLAVYLASNPLIQWLKQPERKADMKKWAIGYSAAAAAFGLPLVFYYPPLLLLALPGGVSLLINIRFALRKQERHLLNDLAAIAGLCLGAVAAY
ncbi:MAG: YwiC-like family protein, partial [Tumebacillaceae bacterium]